MTWFWMNVPLAVAFFAAWTGIPLWLLVKDPDQPSAAGGSTEASYRPDLGPGGGVRRQARRARQRCPRAAGTYH